MLNILILEQLMKSEKMYCGNEYLKKTINSLENCTSMKITKPLRTIKNIVKSKFKK